MEKKWEDLQKKLQEEADRTEIKVPDTLKPESIEAMLNEKTKKKKGGWKAAYTYVAAAAGVCLLIGGIISGRFLVHQVTNMADTGTLKDGEVNTKSWDAETPKETVATAKDYSEIYEYLQEQQTHDEGKDIFYEKEIASDATAKTENSGAAAKYTSGEHSDTNVRQAGVGEGDSIKTDGKYLYSVKDGQLIQIVDVQEKEMNLAGTIDMSKDGSISEIYLKDEKLYVCYTEDVTSESNDYYAANTCIKTFDVSNPKEAKEIGKVSQSGNFYTMRISGDYIYLFSQYTPYNVSGGKKYTEQYIPYVQKEKMGADRIYMPITPSGSEYTVIASIRMDKPDEIMDSKALLSSAGMCYVSNESIYMCEQVYGDGAAYNRTAIRKIDYKDGKLTAIGQTKVWGALNDSFSIDEYEGALRMVTTISPQNNNFGSNPISSLKDFIQEGNEDATDTSDNSEAVEEEKDTNALYVLDENLKQVGKIEGLAKEEQIYSARFLGNIAYFVTYKQVDPLFSADLSDPQNPKILGELKIPGFSEYLHPYSENLLLGIGMDTDEDGMTTNGVKLSMFDISNPANVSEMNKQILKNVYGSDVFYDYKTVLIDGDKNLIGFSAYGDSQHYYLYSYDDNSGFTCLLDKELSANWYGDPRGVYVGNRLYIFEGYAIESYDLTTFDKIDDIVL